MNLNSKKKHSITQLSDHDRKILNKYTKHYTNLIESNTAVIDGHEEERFKGRELL